MVTRMEQLIRDGNVDDFYEHEGLWAFYMGFIHHYKINAVSKYHVNSKLSDPVDPHCTIYDLVSYTYEVFAMVVYLDNYEGWKLRASKPSQDKIHKTCVGRTRWKKGEEEPISNQGNENTASTRALCHSQDWVE